MENNKTIPATTISRIFAFLIDAFCVYIFRFFYIIFSLRFFLKDKLFVLLKNYEMLFGKFNIKKMTQVELNYIIRSDFFKCFVIFLIGAFLISTIYNLILLSTKWSATVGQKLLKIYVVSKDDSKIKPWQIVLRSFLVVIPWAIIFVIMDLKIITDLSPLNLISKNMLTIFIVIVLTWYDLVFFTKNKLTLHDCLTSTKVIMKYPEEYTDESRKTTWRKFFPSVKDMYKSLKEFATEQFAKAKQMKEEYKKQKDNKKD